MMILVEKINVFRRELGLAERLQYSDYPTLVYLITALSGKQVMEEKQLCYVKIDGDTVKGGRILLDSLQQG